MIIAEVRNLAIKEVNEKLYSDLSYCQKLHDFIIGKTNPTNYLTEEFGFMKFVNEYSVARTLAQGEEAKLKILTLLNDFEYTNELVCDVEKIAVELKLKKLSSNTRNSGKSLPISFSSKFLFIKHPDKIMPYDSYVLNSLKINSKSNIKSIPEYYYHAKKLKNWVSRNLDTILIDIKLEMENEVKILLKHLKLNRSELIAWRFTDKYLWAQESIRKMNAA